MTLNRRLFLSAASLAFAAGSERSPAEEPADRQAAPDGQTDARPLIVSTWGFGRAGNERALQVVQDGGTTLDGVEAGIRLVETAGIGSVGLGGRPNAAGYAQLDACIMHGPGQQAGSVAAIEGIVHPITAARRVMENTPHVMLAGEGARWFALQEELESVEITDNEQKKKTWLETQQAKSSAARTATAATDVSQETATGDGPRDTHDTITLLALGEDGTISGGCSTSGWANKLPGRVGDSPIIGSGLYVDNEVGAAGATGLGENVMRYCASFQVVELMRQGLHPQQACRQTIDRIARVDPAGQRLDINFVALDKRGRFGAAGTGRFPYSVTYPGFSRVLRA